MNQQSFEELIGKLEAYARRQPLAYKLEVACLAVLGYAYFAAMVASIALISGVASFLLFGRDGLLAVEAIILLLAVVWTRVWWSRMDFHSPDGYSLVEQEVPHLFAMIDNLTKSLKAPRIHHVMLTNEFNAGIVQVPRYGPLGCPINYLVVGLPLMQSLSPQQFRAVIAHEVAHLSGNHGRFSAWIYRIRQSWITVLENLDEPARGGGFVFGRFLHWYAPYFSAYSFVLARNNEFVADRNAAEAVGKRTLADALVATRVKSSFVENQFWPDIFNAVVRNPSPPTAPHASMFHALPNSPYGRDAERWFEEALIERTNFADTHPSLGSRLAALGFRAGQMSPDSNLPPTPPLPMPAPLGVTAGDQYLGRMVIRFTRHFDEDWHEQVAQSWRELHREAQLASGELLDLQVKAAQGKASIDDLWTLFELVNEHQGELAAMRPLEQLLMLKPHEPRANYALGQILLKNDLERGVTLLDRAMSSEPDCTIPACDTVYYFLKRTAQFSRAVEYRQKGDAYRELVANAKLERSSISSSDTFVHHSLGIEHIRPLRARLSQYPGVREAYLVRKKCRLLPDKPFYVLAIVPNRSRLNPGRNTVHQGLAVELASAFSLPGEARLVLLVGRHRKLARALSRMTGALLFTRSRRK